jgi:hypothetical protein
MTRLDQITAFTQVGLENSLSDKVVDPVPASQRPKGSQLKVFISVNQSIGIG